MRLARVVGMYGGLALLLCGIAAVQEYQARQSFAREIRSGNWRAVRGKLERGRDPNTRSPNGTTPLMLAAEAGDLVYLRKLLDGGVKIDDGSGETAVTWAAGAGQATAVDLLLDRGAMVAIGPTTWSVGPRQAAFAGGHKGLHRELLRRERLSRTLIDLCENADASSPIYSRVKTLLDRGAIVNGYDMNGTALRWVAARRDLETARLLLERHANPSPQTWAGMLVQPFEEALVDENTAMMLLLLKHGCDPNEQGSGLPPLMGAVYSGNGTVVRELIAAGANVNYRLGSGETALSVARQKKNLQIVQILEAAGAR